MATPDDARAGVTRYIERHLLRDVEYGYLGIVEDGVYVFDITNGDEVLIKPGYIHCRIEAGLSFEPAECIPRVALDPYTRCKFLRVNGALEAVEFVAKDAVRNYGEQAPALGVPSFPMAERGGAGDLTPTAGNILLADGTQFSSVPLDASIVPYEPGTPSDYAGSPDHVDEALDELADRVTTIETDGVPPTTATTTALGGVRVDHNPNAGVPIGLTLALLAVMTALLGGDSVLPSFELPPGPVVSVSETSRWVRSPSDPIMEATETWEGTGIYEPNVRYEAGLFKMYYTGYFGINPGIGYATSTDGITFTKYAGNPVVGQGGSSIAGWAARSYVFKFQDTYYMYYNDSVSNLKVATSADGISWTDAGTAMAAAAVAWADGWANSYVWWEDGTFYMLVDRYSASGGSGNQWATALATSPDGLTFTPSGSGPLSGLRIGTGIYGAAVLANPVQKRNGVYYIWYHASSSGNTPTDMYRATTTDWVTFTQYAGNPILTHSGSGYELDQVADPSVLEVNGKSYFYFDGTNNPDNIAAIEVLTFDGPLAALVEETGLTAYLDADNLIPFDHLPLATSSTPGIIQPDNLTLTVDGSGVMSTIVRAFAPLVTGELPGPVPMVTVDGQFIMVPV